MFSFTTLFFKEIAFQKLGLIVPKCNPLVSLELNIPIKLPLVPETIGTRTRTPGRIFIKCSISPSIIPAIISPKIQIVRTKIASFIIILDIFNLFIKIMTEIPTKRVIRKKNKKLTRRGFILQLHSLLLALLKKKMFINIFKN